MPSPRIKRRSTALPQLLREHGLRATAARVAVLELLQASKRPLSHAEVWQQMPQLGHDRATVYRNLIDMTEANLLRRSDLGDHVWRFERIGEAGGHNAQAHPHFVCQGCGSVRCLPEDAVALHLPRRAPKALLQPQLEIQLRGLCDACSA